MNLQGVVFVSLMLFASGVKSQQIEDDFVQETMNLIQECSDKPITICVKERALKYLERLPNAATYNNGLIISPVEGVKRSARYFNPAALPNEPKAREEALDAVLMDRIIDYLSSHTFQFKVPEDSIRELKRSLENEDDSKEIDEGRKKKGKKSLPYLLLFKMKAATIGVIMLKAIGLLAFKALIVAKIALLLGVILMLKKIVDSNHHQRSTYEVISHPIYEDHHDRSIVDTSELPYRGWVNNNNNS